MKCFNDMYKVILNQPWAEMASAGLMTVVHIGAPPEDEPKRISFNDRESNHLIYDPRELYQYRL